MQAFFYLAHLAKASRRHSGRSSVRIRYPPLIRLAEMQAFLFSSVG
jgi:hypothetical protein